MDLVNNALELHIINYVLISSIIAAIVSIIENSSNNNSFKNNVVEALLAFGVAGMIVDYVPRHNIYIAVLIGILSGIMTEDLLDKLRSNSSSYIDKILDIIFLGIKSLLCKVFGIKQKSLDDIDEEEDKKNNEQSDK